MNVIRVQDCVKVALIDPKKVFGESGQCVKVQGDVFALAVAAARARVEGKEIRWYYKDLDTESGEKVAVQIIVTEVPPGHVQPFHTHQALHEVTYIQSGCVVAIDSDSLTESDKDDIRTQGTMLRAGDMVIEEPGVRHTIMNPDAGSYCIMTTVQSARIPMEKFPHDWVRDKPVTKN